MKKVDGLNGSPQSKIACLDKGFVRLVDHMGSDLTVVNAARVSFAKESQLENGTFLSDKDTKLIRYLARGCSTKEFEALVESLVDCGDRDAIKQALLEFRETPLHHTPFGHPQITLHFKWPVFCARQAMRSNIGICWNEVSRRYVDDTPEFYCPAEWRKRPDKSIKQGSGESVVDAVANTIYDDALLCCEYIYNTLLKKGYAPEMARIILPQSTYTECWGTFSLAALARFYNLRSDSHAQKEIQDFARAISELVEPLFPVSWAALTSKE